MIPYIIINGVKSTNINGLIIQKLPPITRPKIRTEVEEIDGRDGDIVTQLGFEAYDKTLTIGLYGDYNVDEVIKYFNAGGRVIFSNEPDKFYNFYVYEKIDFNKLVNFKTANVTMHVQPFKYDAEERELTFTRSTFVIRNKGNIYSRPSLYIKGTGTILFYINNNQVLEITMPANGQIIIDAADMNAKSISGAYLNRRVKGDYNNIKLDDGNNTIDVVGNMTSVTFSNFSRWI